MVKNRLHYVNGQLYVSMDSLGRILLPRNVFSFQGYRVVHEGNDVHILCDKYNSIPEDRRITIQSPIRKKLNLKPECIFRVDKAEERIILTKVDPALIEGSRNT